LIFNKRSQPQYSNPENQLTYLMPLPTERCFQ
jgi:hypothetical protein